MATRNEESKWPTTVWFKTKSNKYLCEDLYEKITLLTFDFVGMIIDSSFTLIHKHTIRISRS